MTYPLAMPANRVSTSWDRPQRVAQAADMMVL